MITTQLAVIGAGPGGYAGAFLAADLGLSVVLIDPEANPGGVCVYRGCIPSKALLHVAALVDEAKHATGWGIDFGQPKIDLDRLRGFKDGVVKRLTGGTGQLVKARKITYLRGLATIVDAHHLRVTLDGKTEDVQFEHAMIATGSVPVVPPALNVSDPRVMDSSAALDLPDIPKSLLVVGGGYIGLELGSVYAALGSAVTVVEMTAGLLPGADRDLVDVLAKRLTALMSSVLLETKVVAMKPEAKGISVTFEGMAVAGDAGNVAKTQTFDRVLVAVGRRPNSAIPGLDKTHVQVDQRGFIMVDEQRRTHEPSIFAIGDVVGEPMLAHKASHEARVAVEVMAGENVAFAPRAIPAVVFTDPELAWAGLTEAQAVKEGRDVTVAKFPWAASGRAITLDRTDGLTKLILDPESERLLGIGIVGPGAGEMIAEGVLAIEMGANATDLKLSIHPHPTLTETVMESAEVFFGQATHVYRPKKVRSQKSEV
jgi:dihydrolipoamide dehydrogenase